jgi:CelD/BcsL family acetyltransferase involved in cellulose biosynthesis
LDRKRRKLEREVGPIRFDWHTTDPRVFDALLAWKARQRKVTRTPDILRLRWSIEVVRRIRDLQEDGLSGLLSALWAGDRLAAVHLGMRTCGVLHYWIPAYSEELSNYSPGLLALMELARAGAERGVRRLDLGPGDERYKQRAASAAMQLADAVVSPGPAARRFTQAFYRLRAWTRGSSVESWARGARRVLRRASYAVRSALERGPDRPTRR